MILPSGNVTLNPAIANLETVADLLEHLGGIPAERVRWKPLPGTATEQDVIAAEGALEKRLCELIDGTLVEKAMGFYEARLALVLSYFLEAYLEKHDLGVCSGSDAMLLILPQQVRMPDVCFVSWDRLPNRELPAEPIANLSPDLAVEVLSISNTRREMQRKRGEYFQAGTRLVWEIDPRTQTARSYTAPDQFQEIDLSGSLEGGDVLPGFVLPLRQLFDRAGRQRGT